MKRSLCLIILILWVVYAFAQQQEKLVFGTQHFPPFSMNVNNTATGPGVEIIEALCQDAGLAYEIKIGVWRGIQAMAQNENSNINALFFLGKNTEREEWLHFSPPILETEYGFFSKNSATIAYQKATKLENLTIGVYGPSNTAKSLDKISKRPGNDFKVSLTKDSKTAFRVLSLSNRLDLVFSNKDVGNSIIANNKFSNLKYIGKDKSLHYYFAFSRAKIDKKTLDILDKSFAKLIANGTIAKILEKYNMKPAP